MALAIPFAFAGLGYLGFGSTGAAVGWLVGAWLFGPKAETENQIFDPGAEEMPRWNQSLRGVTIPVFFGTNRVSSNTVWVNNFQTIRKETSQPQQGGGKGGGSGMGGKGGGQASSTQVSYEYKWDLMFHLGLTPEPYGLFGGWVNTQRMAGDTVLAIINNAIGMPPISSNDPDNTTYTVNGVTSQATQSGNTASLTFDDSFYGPGGATGDDSYPAWDYFEAVVGQPVRWPNTAYVGFKALSLGSSPQVPQLSFEIGPGTATLTRDPTYLNEYNSSDWRQGSNCMLKGEDGKHYLLIGDDDDVIVWCCEDDTTQTVLLADLPNTVGAAPAGAKHFAAGGSPYFLHLGWGFPGGSDLDLHGRLYKIDATGTVVTVEDYEFTQAEGQKYAITLAGPVGFGFMSFDNIMDQESGFLTWVLHYRHTLLGPRQLLMTVPYRGNLGAAGTIYPVPDDQNVDTPLPVPNKRIFFQQIDTDGIGGSPSGLRFSSVPRAFFLPEYHPENSPLLNGKWPITYWVAYYVSKAMIAADDGSSDLIGTYKATYPNGFIVGYELVGGSPLLYPNGLIIGTATILNDKFCDGHGTPLPALFDDSGKDIDGTANQFCDYFAPSTDAITSGQGKGGVVVVFPKVFDKIADQGTAQSYFKMRVFAWNPTEQKGKLYTSSEGAAFDLATDVGISAAGVRNTPQNIATFYDLDDGNLYFAGQYTAASAASSRHIASIWGPLNIGGGTDVLIPYIIYQILTHPVFGIGFTEDDVDQDSYALALQYADAQGFRVSVQYTREEDVLAVIEELLSLMGGFLTISGGKVKFGVQQFTGSSVRVIDNHHLVPPKEGDPPVSVTKGALQDGYNKVRINYYDRALDYRQNQYEIGDEVDQDINGVRFKEFPPRFVMDLQMAQAVAERALWTNLYARDTYKFTLGWKDADLEPGDVVTLVDSFHPELSSGKEVRIVHWHEKSRGTFDVTAVIEVPYYQVASHSIDAVYSVSPSRGQFEQPLPCVDFRMYELPREFQASAGNLYVGYNQQSNIRGAALWLSPDGVSYSLAKNAEPYIISGQFAQPLPALYPGAMMQDVEIWVLPSSGFTTQTPTFCQTVALDDISAAVRASGGGIMICGSEALSMENLTLLGQNHYRIGRLYRGWGGTAVGEHSSGAYWHRHAGGIFADEISADKIGSKVWYKVVPYNFAGKAVDVSSVEGKEYEVRGGYWVPQALSQLRVWVSSPLTATYSENLRGDFFRGVVSGGCDVTVEWSDVARAGGFGFGGFGKMGYGHFNADLDPHTFRVEVLQNDAVVRSIEVSTTAYEYAREVNSADFNGFAAEFQFRVTPVNIYGPAAYGWVKSLHVFSGALAPDVFGWDTSFTKWDTNLFTFDKA